MKKNIKKIIEHYKKMHNTKKEFDILVKQLEETNNIDTIFNRKTLPGHITASGFVLSPNMKKILLINHKFLQKLIQPGGHVDETDETIEGAALRDIDRRLGLAALIGALVGVAVAEMTDMAGTGAGVREEKDSEAV